jgi:large subunit ribosomal protein L5
MKQITLKQKYETEIVPKLAKEFNIGNKMAVPRVEKVVVNMGIGQISKDKGKIEQAAKELAQITGQKPSVRPAKISVAGFSLRRGAPVGLKITLRREKMYAFLQRLFSIVLPRLRDFRGVSLKSFDKEGNYSLGITEHTVFPEIDLGETTAKGLEITIVTNTNDRKKAEKLLASLGMPFEKEE